MIYITGDCHGDFTRFNTKNFPEQKEMTLKDTVIILGDFGAIWNEKKHTKNEKHVLDWLENKPFTILWIDGNHENFDRLYSEFPVTERFGGKVHCIRNNIFHLIRGEIYNIEELKFFAFGGASSHDISDGILEYENWKKEAKQLNKEGKFMYRINHISWWKEELPSEEEMQNGISNLEKENWKVDYVLTHSPSASVIALLGQGLYEQDILTKYLENIRIKLNYKKWFSGHMHVNMMINDTDLLLYEQIIRIH